jgi:hypothetical protein
VSSANRLKRRCYGRYDPYGMRQRMRNRGLNDYVGGVAKCAIRLRGLTVRVDVPNLHRRGANNECTAKEANRHPERTKCSLIGAATYHSREYNLFILPDSWRGFSNLRCNLSLEVPFCIG